MTQDTGVTNAASKISVVYIAHYFPPAGGGGVQRTSKFVKYLNDFGIKTTVITRKRDKKTFWAPTDETLQNDIPKEVTVYRVEEKENQSDSDSMFIETAIRAIEKHKPNIILVTASPYSDITLTRRISELTGLPWVIDLRDPWALDEFMVFRGWLDRISQYSKMKSELFRADRIIMNTPEARNRLLSKWPKLANNTPEAITNGFDPEDFPKIKKRLRNPRFTIVHTGTLYGYRNEDPIRKVLSVLVGKRNMRVDSSTRSIWHLFAGLELLLAKDPEIRNQIQIKLVGASSDSEKTRIQNSALREIVEISDYVTHQDSIRLLEKADLLYLPMHNLPKGKRATIVPGKIYEYIASGRPILASIPDGDAKDFLFGYPQSYVTRPDNVVEISKSIEKSFREWETSHSTNECPDKLAEKFNRAELTSKLVDVLVSAVERKRADSIILS